VSNRFLTPAFSVAGHETRQVPSGLGPRDRSCQTGSQRTNVGSLRRIYQITPRPDCVSLSDLNYRKKIVESTFFTISGLYYNFF